MTLYQRQRCGQRFRDQTIKCLTPLIKGSGWNRKSAWVFRVEGDWYLTAFVTGGTTSDGLSNLLEVELGIKPMAVDPINWRAKGLHENLKKSPSFRSSAVFKVPALPIGKRQWSEGLIDVAEASKTVFNATIELAEEARIAVKDKRFSQLVAEHEHAKKYHALKWASLIAEGQGERAIESIMAHYAVDGSADGNYGAAISIAADYQRVIDGTDQSEYRTLATDIFGNPVIDGPVLQNPEVIAANHPSLLARLNAAIRGAGK